MNFVKVGQIITDKVIFMPSEAKRWLYTVRRLVQSLGEEGFLFGSER
jgi:hypothetical protein